MPSARICPQCGKPMPNGSHKHILKRGLPAGAKDMGPVARTDTMLGSPPTKKRR